MSTQPAPLLTAEMAKEWGDTGWAPGCGEALRAIIDGRTACVRVLTEDECKAEYRAWWIARYPDEPIVFDRGWLFHLDRARAMGAVR